MKRLFVRYDRSGRWTAALCLAVACASCGESDTAPSPTSTGTSTAILASTLEPKGTLAYPFNVTASGNVTATLASVTAGTPRQPVAIPLLVGLGTVDGTNCTIVASATLAASLTGQLSTSMTAGSRCVQISDPGTLTGPVDFAVRVVHP